jgi:ribonuclease E
MLTRHAAEERRLAIVDGQNSPTTKLKLKGANSAGQHLAVVTRVESSLEACFVDYGEDRPAFRRSRKFRALFHARRAGQPGPHQRRDPRSRELMVQGRKEERGNKGAALTTFVSLVVWCYVVLMSNNLAAAASAVVSKEGEDRAELKGAMDQLEYPAGSSIIAAYR